MPANVFAGTVEDGVYTAGSMRYRVAAIGPAPSVVTSRPPRSPATAALEPGQAVEVGWRPATPSWSPGTEAMAELDGQVALITGAADGMGRAHAVPWPAGAASSSRTSTPRGPEETVAASCQAGRRAHVAFDIADVAAIRRDGRATLARHGRVDILVNNAGIGQRQDARGDRRSSDLDRMLAVHVKGTFFCTQAVVPAMKRAACGQIINISSRWAQAGHHRPPTTAPPRLPCSA